MGRKRVIDTDELLFDEELYEAVGKDGLWLYVRLWGIAEDFGGYEPKYGSISLKTGVLRISPDQVQDYIEKLISIGKIIPYEVNGKTYHWLARFLKHQRLNNPTLPQIPIPPWIVCESRQYKSGKKYASYEIDEEILTSTTSSIQVGYQKATSKTETKQKRNETETETIKEKDMSKSPAAPSTPPSSSSPVGLVFSVDTLAELWNAKAPPELSRVHLPFRRALKEMAKIRDTMKRNPKLEWWEKVVLRMHNSPFLRGANDRSWKASFDFMVSHAEVILDGKYDGSGGTGPSHPKGFSGLADWAGAQEDL